MMNRNKFDNVRHDWHAVSHRSKQRALQTELGGAICLTLLVCNLRGGMRCEMRRAYLLGEDQQQCNQQM